MPNLKDLGFIEKAIEETIVSTCDVEDRPNAAPMGVVMEDKERILIRPYLSSSTYHNLRAVKAAVVNVTDDPQLFYRTAFKEVNPDGRLPPDWFKKGDTVDSPRLRAADAYIEVSVVNQRSYSEDRAELLCQVKQVKGKKTYPKVYCRASFATIEAIIHATRIKPFLSGNRQMQHRASKLLKQFKICQKVVNRTAPNSQYSEVMTDLNHRIELWKGQK